MVKLNWRKGWFSSKYTLLDGNRKIGEFDQSFFSNTSIGELRGASLKFNKKGFFNCQAEIRDLNLSQSIGAIKFNSLGSKAELKFNDQIYLWKYDNIWQSKWSISQNGQPLIRYKSSMNSGEIESLIDNDILLLSGLFVYNNYVALMVIITVSTVIILSGS